MRWDNDSTTRNILAASSGPVDRSDKARLGLGRAVFGRRQDDQSCQSGTVEACRWSRQPSWRRREGRVRYNSRSRGDRVVGTKPGFEHGMLDAKEAAWHTGHVLVLTGRDVERGAALILLCRSM